MELNVTAANGKSVSLESVTSRPGQEPGRVGCLSW